MLGTVLIVVLIVLLIGGLPHWSPLAASNFGYYPSGLAGVLLIIVIVLLLTGRL